LKPTTENSIERDSGEIYSLTPLLEDYMIHLTESIITVRNRSYLKAQKINMEDNQRKELSIKEMLAVEGNMRKGKLSAHKEGNSCPASKARLVILY